MSKYIRFSQIWTIVKMHFYVSVVAMFMGMIMPGFVIGSIKHIASLIFIFIYMLVLYSKSEDIARHDKKQYTDDVPYIWKGMLLPVGVFIIWGMLYVLFHFSWKYDIVNSFSGFTNNLLFVFWNYVYIGFMNMMDGQFDAWALVLVFIIPLIACGGGYMAGYKGFDLSSKVAKLVYDKKEENDNDIQEG